MWKTSLFLVAVVVGLFLAGCGDKCMTNNCVSARYCKIYSECRIDPPYETCHSNVMDTLQHFESENIHCHEALKSHYSCMGSLKNCEDFGAVWVGELCNEESNQVYENCH